jgi:tRNA pseudouridine38/39 synthase
LSRGRGVRPRESEVASEFEQDSSGRNDDDADEIRYVHILNRVLPSEIRVLAWCPVEPSFSARFSCTSRTYKYFFPRGQLNLSSMRDAANRLIGEHDFRNLCKMDVGNGVVNYIRCITAVELKSSENDNDNGYDMCELTIVGQAFLWHQIRCIVSVLFLVGQQREQPTVVSDLLDVDRFPRKPQYTMASELPLNLFNCCYDNCDIDWRRDRDTDDDVVRTFQATWTQMAVRQTMLRRMLDELTECEPIRHQADCLIPGNHVKTYKPLFQRELCDSLEDRIEYYAKKRQRTK